MNNLHLALLEVRKSVKAYPPATGICDLTSGALRWKDYDTFIKLRSELKDLMRKWPEYSGDALFPVPAPDGGCPEACYLKAKTLWGL